VIASDSAVIGSAARNHELLCQSDMSIRQKFETRELSVNKRKPVLGVKEPTAEEAATTDTTMPKNPSANTIPSKGYVLEVDGKFKSEFETSDAAMKSALDLKKKYPQIKVNVYDAKEHARTLVDLTEKSAVPIGPA